MSMPMEKVLLTARFDVAAVYVGRHWRKQLRSI